MAVGLDYYEPRLPFKAVHIGRFRRLPGEDGIEQLFKATIETALCALVSDVAPAWRKK